MALEVWPSSGIERDEAIALQRLQRGIFEIRDGHVPETLSEIQKIRRSADVQTQSKHPRNSVRRLTPLEAERLQGYPDGWTDIPPMESVSAEDLAFWRPVWDTWCDIQSIAHKSDKQIRKWLMTPASDGPRYKALGNSIALPFWAWLCKRISAQYVGRATMGSLFDGIGGFPLVWERVNGRGSCLWASEIEPFPIRVTRYRFDAKAEQWAGPADEHTPSA